MNNLRPGFAIPAWPELARTPELLVENRLLKAQLETKTAAAIEIQKLLLAAEKEIAELKAENARLKDKLWLKQFRTEEKPNVKV